MLIVVPGHPSSDGLTWWVMTEGGRTPKIHLAGPGADHRHVEVRALGLSSEPSQARNAFLVATRGLRPDQEYSLTASLDGAAPAWARSRTLPSRLGLNETFTIAVGSCYCMATDRGVSNGNAYPPASHRAGSPDPIRLRILCGDQIYMDLSRETGNPVVVGAPDPWRRYEAQWQDRRFRPFLCASPNLFLADDHEFWNDYPHGNFWLTWDESRPGGPVGRRMDRAYSVFQAALNLPHGAVSDLGAGGLEAALIDRARTFSFSVPPLRVLVLDTRTTRNRYDDSRPRFCKPGWLEDAVRWVKADEGPGVLVLGQPVVEERAGWFARLTHSMGDLNLPDFDEDFADLWTALAEAPHDMLVVSGDIHWSRLYRVRPRGWRADGRPRRVVYEAITSPVSKIPSVIPLPGTGPGDYEKVVWDRPGGVADVASYYENEEPATYLTLGFTPLSNAPRAPIRVRAEAWGLPAGPGLGARLIQSQTITMESIS